MSSGLQPHGETRTMNTVIYLGLLILELAFIARAIPRPHREPAARIAWVVVIAGVPIAGILAYLLFGETSIGRRLNKRAGQVLAAMPPLARASAAEETRLQPEIPERCAPLFRLGETINGFAPVGGNSARLLADSNATIEAMVADIDAAEDHVHLATYIWLADGSGLKLVEALKRAAARGVTCRAIADGLGSRAMVSSSHWKEMGESGVHLAVALHVGSVLRGPSHGRLDLRNHRKIVVIDDTITYCGSQNCADPEFRVKAKYAPWVDAVMRFEGPIARQNQHVFVSDWMTYADEDVVHLLTLPIRAPRAGFTAQVIATGPTVRYSAMPETFESLIFAARDRLTITTPYYVPNGSTQSALCTAAHRGVDTRIVFPARNDSRFVAAASRSYYRELLAAGVRIHEYVGGLLHTKSLTLDGEMTLIGSANIDRRSFDLNYENNILFHDADLTAAMCERQEQYLAAAKEVTMADVASWSTGRRLWNDSIGMLGALL